MKRVAVLISMMSGFVAQYSGAAISISEMEQVSPVIDTLNTKYNKINDSAIKLAVSLAQVRAALQDVTKSYGDKFVAVALFINELTPTLELIIGSSKQDIIKEHKETGILEEVNKIAELLGKRGLAPSTLSVLQDATGTLESLSLYLTNSAQTFRNIKQ